MQGLGASSKIRRWYAENKIRHTAPFRTVGQSEDFVDAESFHEFKKRLGKFVEENSSWR